MNTKTPIVTTILLALTILMIIPTGFIPKTHASSANFQTTETNWSPFGPRMEQVLITSYSDFNAMFSAFQSGSLDVTDWPLDPAHLATFNTNPDVYITAKQPEFGIFQLDMNHHHTLFGVAQQVPRTKIAATFTTSTAANTCGVGFGTVNVQLINRENSSSIVKDSFNTVTLQEFPLGSPVNQANDASASGTYTFTCIPAETPLTSAGYTIASTEYNTTTSTKTTVGATSTFLAAIAVGSQQTVNVVLTVQYLSPSTVSETQAGIYLRAALNHMLDKPDFVQSDSSLGGLAQCDDISGPSGWGLTGAACLYPPNSLTGQNGFNPAVLEATECGPISSVDPSFTAACTVGSYLSAYHIGPAAVIGTGSTWWNTQGTGTAGYSSPNDIRAACDYMVLAGLTLTPSGSTCAGLATQSTGTTAPNPSTQIHFVAPSGAQSVVTMYIRTSLARNHFGQTIADTVNMMFGTQNSACVSNGGTAFSAVDYGTKEPKPCTIGTSVVPQYYTIGQIVNIVFADAGKDQWNLYTGGFSLGSTPDFLFTNFHSSFASATCGGVFNSFPSNYNYNCSPQYDAYSNAAEFSTSTALGNNIFNQVGLISMKTAEQDPVYTVIDQFAELNCLNWQPGSQSSIVRTLGHGTEIAFQSLLNAQFNPYYTPTAPATYSCGGQGQSGFVPETLRRGFSQDTDNMNPFQALTVWDFEIISQVFDTMLALNPVQPFSSGQVFDWMTQGHSHSTNPAQISCIGAPTNAVPSCVTGTGTQVWHLRHDIFFHDGTQVNANDVCSSVIANRDVPGALTFGSVFNVASCIPSIGGGTSANPDTATITLQGATFDNDFLIGGIFIQPFHGPHSWATACGGSVDAVTGQSTIIGPDGAPHPYTSIPGAPTSQCANPAYDPMAAGLMVGSGPWVCPNIDSVAHGPTAPNAPGGPCTSSHNAVITLGQTALLTANHNYMRGPPDLQGSPLQTQLWADKFNVGQVNIVDIADAALHFGTVDSYWGNTAYTCTGGTTVDICAVGTAAADFGHGLTSPFPESGAGSLSLIDMSSLAFSIGGNDATAMQTGENTCGTICISAQRLYKNADGNLHILVSSNTNLGTLANVRVQVGNSNAPFATVLAGNPCPLALGDTNAQIASQFANSCYALANGNNDINTGIAVAGALCPQAPNVACTEATVTFNVIYNSGGTIGLDYIGHSPVAPWGTLYQMEVEDVPHVVP